MKRTNYFLMTAVAVLALAACNSVSYKKTKSGLLYKIIPGKGKDSLIRNGNTVKFNVTYTLNDSVLYTSYGKAPAYFTMQHQEQLPYNLIEILPQMRKGDSAITVQMTDTLLAKGMQLPVSPKKGSRLTTSFRIIEVFAVDSIARADYAKEMEKDRPRQMKEQEENMAKEAKEREKLRLKEEEEVEKSGEAAKQVAALEAFFASKNIKAVKAGKGTFVVLTDPGTGAQAADGKYVTVNYVGKFVDNDSTFDSGSFERPLGKGALIIGLEDGLKSFKEGAKGTVYIAGYRAYGRNHPPGWDPYEALKFDIICQKVADNATTPQEGQ